MSEQKDFYIKDGELVCYLGDSTDIVIPDGVQRIGNAVFIDNDISFKNCNCLKRKNIIIPEDAEIIMEAEEPWRCGCGRCFFTRTPFTPVEMIKGSTT